MIKKIISLLALLVLVFSLTACQEPEENPDQEASIEQSGSQGNKETQKIGGCSQVIYLPTYEEVKNHLDLINEQDFDGDRFLFFDCFEGKYEVLYKFDKIAHTGDNPTSLEEFFDDSSMDFLSWNVLILLDDGCTDGEDCLWVKLTERFYPSGELDINNHKAGFSVTYASSKEPIEAFNPELLTIEKEFLLEGLLDQVRYTIKYDGNNFIFVKACVELSDDVLNGIVEAILNAYNS